MSEKPLDRLNYYNGQRLEASDLKLEQQYQIRVRRWLNKSLYTTGIARGLEVVKDPVTLTNIYINPGLALDVEGREIILLDQINMQAIGTPSPVVGQVDGNYLVIQYSEQVTEVVEDGCVTRPGKRPGCGGNSLAWGGPAFLRAQPILSWTDILPDENSGKIVLAQVELDNSCNVRSVHPEVRRYLGAASEATVRQYALEGEREVSSGIGTGDPSENFAEIYFHIRGREPSSVSLFLKADTFPTLRYTEMGDHTHALSETGNVTTSAPTYPEGINAARYQHSHKVPSSTTIAGASNPDGDHTGVHGFNVAFNLVGTQTGYLDVSMQAPFTGVYYENILGNDMVSRKPIIVNTGTDSSQNPILPPQITGGAHSHTIPQIQSDAANPFTNDDHTHTVALASMGNAGVTDPAFPNGSYSARSGAPLTYVNNLQIFIDGHNHTDDILSQLKDSTGTDWPTKKLGNGTNGNPLVIDPSDRSKGGTGEIKLDLLPGVSFTEGEHWIEIHSQTMDDGSPTGGRVLYNLYIE